uniref:Copia protein n=1 Tax=Cajanus cajan TaxID=3821 RepID=A0A151TW21_CAJCA|nr:Copia protein [Cajanus cajan]
MSIVSKFMHDPWERHMQTIDRTLQYLKSSPRKGLLFKRGDTMSLEIFTNASQSQIGDILLDNACSWGEFGDLAQGICEGLWMKIILNDHRIKIELPMKLFCDNKSTINIAQNLIQHDKTKHIEIDRHFIKEKLDNGLIVIAHIRHPYKTTSGICTY